MPSPSYPSAPATPSRCTACTACRQKDIAKELGVSPTLVNFMIRDALVHCRKVTAERQGDNLANLSARR